MRVEGGVYLEYEESEKSVQGLQRGEYVKKNCLVTGRATLDQCFKNQTGHRVKKVKES